MLKTLVQLKKNALLRKSIYYLSTQAKTANPIECHYDTLEIPKNASLKEIKKSFKSLTKKYHPDVYKGDDKEKYSRILEAYEILRNPARRKKYDFENQAQGAEFTSSARASDTGGLLIYFFAYRIILLGKLLDFWYRADLWFLYLQI